jgi:hypothetical protein
MVCRDHLQSDNVFEHRFARDRLFVLEVVKVSAMHHAVIVIIRDVSVHGVEWRQRKAESQEGDDRDGEVTHAASLSSASRAAPVVCIGGVLRRKRFWNRATLKIRSSAFASLAPRLVGLLGFEPRTKGFTFIGAFPPRVDYLFTRSS